MMNGFSRKHPFKVRVFWCALM